jgi:Tfp pilus assembly protein PilX
VINSIRHRISRARAGEEGFAMLTVLLVLLVMSTIGSAVLAQAITGLPQVRHEQDFSAALAAAEAGIDDFTDRLDQNYNYATSASDGNLALTSYVAVGPGSTSSYTYRVVASSLCSGTPNVCVTSTGKVGKVKRSITVGLQPHGFLDALDMSDYNLVDPALIQANGWSVAQTTSECVYHAYDTNTYAGGTGPASGCGGLLNYWVTGNTFNGPLESNDDFYICGSPIFNSTVTSGDSGTTHPHYWLDPAGCGGDNPHFNGGAPVGNQRITLPPSVQTIQQYAATGTSTGCLFTGPTSITLSGTTMTVVSPDTKSTNPNCVGAGKPLPADGTIYVQDQTGVGDPNYWSSGCQVNPSWDGDACNLGDAFVQGITTGKLTIAASNNVIITGSVGSDLVGSDVLGLIANNFVEINHPVFSGSGPGSQCWSGTCNTHGTVAFSGTTSFTVPLINPTVNAAILALNHAFGVMNFNQGSIGELGNINLTGSLTGKFMDTEGEFDGGGQESGYGVSYTYDSRLQNGKLLPPNFLNPTSTFYHRVSYAEVSNPSWS